jgi:hypothetical protein
MQPAAETQDLYPRTTLGRIDWLRRDGDFIELKVTPRKRWWVIVPLLIVTVGPFALAHVVDSRWLEVTVYFSAPAGALVLLLGGALGYFDAPVDDSTVTTALRALGVIGAKQFADVFEDEDTVKLKFVDTPPPEPVVEPAAESWRRRQRGLSSAERANAVATATDWAREHGVPLPRSHGRLDVAFGQFYPHGNAADGAVEAIKVGWRVSLHRGHFDGPTTDDADPTARVAAASDEPWASIWERGIDIDLFVSPDGSRVILNDSVITMREGDPFEAPAQDFRLYQMIRGESLIEALERIDAMHQEHEGDKRTGPEFSVVAAFARLYAPDGLPREWSGTPARPD